MIIGSLYNLYFGFDNKRNFAALQIENQELLSRNQTLSEKNNSIESDIKSMQKSDAHAERFAREELNLIYEDEQYLNFKENDSNEPQS